MGIQEFSGGNPNARRKLNDIVADVNALKNITGDQCISVRRTNGGVNISLSVDVLRQKLPYGGSGGTSAIQAIVVKGLAYPNLSADPESLEYLGREYYEVRLSDSAIKDWIGSTDYIVDDKVTSEEFIYNCIVPNIGIQPGVSAGWEGYWEKVDSIIIDRAIGNTLIQTDFDLRNYIPWFAEGEKVIVISLDGKYFFWQTLSYVGKPTESSLLSFENRTRAVFA